MVRGRAGLRDHRIYFIDGRKGSREKGRQVGKWNRDGRMAKFLALFIVMRIGLMTMKPSVQYSDRESLSALKSGS